jgi:predicted RND superfamily exporter protein
LTYQKDLRGLGNAIRVVVENTDGDIFDPRYMEALKQISDELILTPGVDRALGQVAVDAGGALDGSDRGRLPRRRGDAGFVQRLAAERRAVKQNIARSGIVGSLVANDFKSSMIFVPLLDTEPGTGKRIDYHASRRCWRRRSAPNTSSRRNSTRCEQKGRRRRSRST